MKRLRAPTNGADPTAHSYLCLSCHDGTAASANFGATGYLDGAAVTVANIPKITNNVANDLRDDHPVNFNYPDPLPAWASGAFALQSAVAAGPNTKLFGTNNTVQCATCHDPHKQNPITTGRFLRTGTTTALCVTCHL